MTDETRARSTADAAMNLITLAAAAQTSPSAGTDDGEKAAAAPASAAAASNGAGSGTSGSTSGVAVGAEAPAAAAAATTTSALAAAAAAANGVSPLSALTSVSPMVPLLDADGHLAPTAITPMFNLLPFDMYGFARSHSLMMPSPNLDLFATEPAMAMQMPGLFMSPAMPPSPLLPPGSPALRRTAPDPADDGGANANAGAAAAAKTATASNNGAPLDLHIMAAAQQQALKQHLYRQQIQQIQQQQQQQQQQAAAAAASGRAAYATRLGMAGLAGAAGSPVLMPSAPPDSIMSVHAATAMLMSGFPTPDARMSQSPTTAASAAHGALKLDLALPAGVIAPPPTAAALRRGPDGSAGTAWGDPTERRTDRERARRSCAPCRAARRACSNNRPCERCVSRNEEHKCVEGNQLPSGRPARHRTEPRPEEAARQESEAKRAKTGDHAAAAAGAPPRSGSSTPADGARAEWKVPGAGGAPESHDQAERTSSAGDSATDPSQSDDKSLDAATASAAGVADVRRLAKRAGWGRAGPLTPAEEANAVPRFAAQDADAYMDGLSSLFRSHPLDTSVVGPKTPAHLQEEEAQHKMFLVFDPIDGRRSFARQDSTVDASAYHQ